MEQPPRQNTGRLRYTIIIGNSAFFRRNSPERTAQQHSQGESQGDACWLGTVSITVEKMTRSMGKTTAAASTARETTTAPMSHRLFP